MKDLGPLNFFLGIAITRTPESLFLSQSKYSNSILEQDGMSSCRPSATPIDTKGKLSTNSGDPFHDPTRYRQLAGALQYLTFTTPDMSYAVQQLRLHMLYPKVSHMASLKRLLRHVKGTLSNGLTLYNSYSSCLH